MSRYHGTMTAVQRSVWLSALASVAPGRPLREGLDRILKAQIGALVVVGDGPDVLNICSGGFLLDAAFSPQRLGELAKMDGAIILAPDASRIARANVHLVPNPNVPTSETGTRHRTAERVARSIDVPVLSVSEDQRTTSLYLRDVKHPLSPTSRLLDKANQALATLRRYRERLDRQAAELTIREIENVVTIRDVVDLLQVIEAHERIAIELEREIVELGVDGHMVDLQATELTTGVTELRALVLADYEHDEMAAPEEVLEALAELPVSQLSDDDAVARVLNIAGVADLDRSLSPRGYRQLSVEPLLTTTLVDTLVENFGGLQKVLGATTEDLVNVGGLDTERAAAVRDGILRLSQNLPRQF
ncbi:MAG: DNA integrity scanning diadenylate cyclase DisA [Acidimicrobiales bacterium]